MASIQEEASGKKSAEIRYLTPLDIDQSTETDCIICCEKSVEKCGTQFFM